jgi:hypothetical protein
VFRIRTIISPTLRLDKFKFKTYSSPSLIKFEILFARLVKAVFPPRATAKAVRTADFPPATNGQQKAKSKNDTSIRPC